MPTRDRRKKPISYRNRGASPLTPGIDGKRDLLLRLAQEFQQVSIESMEAIGVTRKEQKATFHRAMRGPAPRDRPSTALMERTFAIADMLSSWRRDKRYREPDGTPRVLPIHGKGATLETLARKFVPTMSVSDVVTAITRHGEAAAYRGDKVALVGASMLLAPKTAEVTLASLVTLVRRVASTVLLNASQPEGRKRTGRFERQVNGVLSERQFDQYIRVMRTQLQDFCDRAEAGLELADRKGRKGKPCGIGIFVYRDD
jgi:hypothetical protein